MLSNLNLAWIFIMYYALIRKFSPGRYPANICWSWRRLKDKSWRYLHHISSVTILRLSRHLEDVYWRGMTKANIFVLIKPSQRRLLKTKTKNFIKTSSSRRIFAGYIAFLKIYPGYRIYTTKGATILGDLGNNMKDRFSFQSNE